ncbi:hypothetical protein TELCIR_17536, partial [Teladorsagia circumcincta]
MEKTCKEFWFMCMQDHVEFIVMLCNFVEKGAKKCFEYFPTSGTMTFGDITVAYAGSAMMRFTCATTAQVRITTLIVERGGR